MTINAIMFDIDGTLVDSNDQHVTAWQAAFAAAGIHFDRRTIHDQIGKGSDMLIPALVPDGDAALEKRLSDAHGDIYKRDFLKAVKPFPDARDLLARARDRGQKLVLASSASAEELEHYLDLLSAREIVTATTSADDVKHSKPAPDIFVAALAKLHLPADQVIVVGDTPYDVQAAGKCDVASIGVRSGGFADEALEAAGAAALYDDVAALLANYERSPLAR